MGSYGQPEYSNAFTMRCDIANVAIELCKSSSLQDIKVSDICESAHIARQTFYKYFANKADIACWVATSIFADSIIRIGDDFTWNQALESVFFKLSNHDTAKLLKDATNLANCQEMQVVQARRLEELILSLLSERHVHVDNRLGNEIKLFSLVIQTLLLQANQRGFEALSTQEKASLVLDFVPPKLQTAFQ